MTPVARKKKPGQLSGIKHRYQDDLKRQILNILNKGGSNSIGELRDMLVMNHYQAHQFITELVEAKLVDTKQKKHDARVRMLFYITGKGKKCLELMNQMAVIMGTIAIPPPTPPPTTTTTKKR